MQRLPLYILPLVLGVLLSAPATAASRPAVPCPLPPDPPTEAQRKFHPGHYVAIGGGELRKGATPPTGPGITGVQLRYRWVDLERKSGSYDFRRIERDLEAASRLGLQLVVLLEDKTFDGEAPTPEDLRERHTLKGHRGYTAARWEPEVRDRLESLVARLGETFDCHPNFEGVGFQETALSLDRAALQAVGYTPEKYRDAQIDLLRSAAASLPRSRVFWYMNFLPGNQEYLGDIASAVAGTGVVMGGPDILPDNQALTRRTYPFYERFRGRLKLFGSMQHDSYRHRRADTFTSQGGYWSMEDLFLFARDRLHVDYVFWEYRTRRQPADARDWSEAREVIARYPTIRAPGAAKEDTRSTTP